MGDLVVGIDVGTHKICTLVGEVRPEDIYVVGLGIEPSAGMKKGVVNDVSALSEAIGKSIRKAEKSSGYDINRAFVSVAGSHISSLTSRGITTIVGPRSVQTEDLEKAMAVARGIAIPHNREVLHVVPRSYTLDGQEGIRSPIGMHCFRPRGRCAYHHRIHDEPRQPGRRRGNSRRIGRSLHSESAGRGRRRADWPRARYGRRSDRHRRRDNRSRDFH